MIIFNFISRIIKLDVKIIIFIIIISVFSTSENDKNASNAMSCLSQPRSSSKNKILDFRNIIQSKFSFHHEVYYSPVFCHFAANFFFDEHNLGKKYCSEIATESNGSFCLDTIVNGSTE